MKKQPDSFTANDRKTLREGIRNRYWEYHLSDKVTYPDFEFNTNRLNYKPLRESFEEEFFVTKGVHRVDNSLHIPSISTFVQIFCEDDYVPSWKMLNTCRAYAEAVTGTAYPAEGPRQAPPKAAFRYSSLGVNVVAALLILAGLVIFAPRFQRNADGRASGLVIERPAEGKVVPMIAVVEGKVSNATTVWIVVRDVKSDVYYVQHPISVEGDGTWRGPVHIGGNNKAHIGALVQIRAFVNPAKVYKLQDEDILYLWPEAELSSSAVQVIRGPETE